MYRKAAGAINFQLASHECSWDCALARSWLSLQSLLSVSVDRGFVSRGGCVGLHALTCLQKADRLVCTHKARSAETAVDEYAACVPLYLDFRLWNQRHLHLSWKQVSRLGGSRGLKMFWFCTGCECRACRQTGCHFSRLRLFTLHDMTL